MECSSARPIPPKGEQAPFSGTGDGVSVGVGSGVLVEVGIRVSVTLGEGMTSTGDGVVTGGRPEQAARQRTGRM